MKKLRLWFRYDARWWWQRRREAALLWLVSRLPREIVYRSTIRLWVHATTGPWSHEEVTAVTIDQALKRWKSSRILLDSPA